jgi:hypothetical protein
MGDGFELVSRKDNVLHVSFLGEKRLFSRTTFIVGELIEEVKQGCANTAKVSYREASELFGEGVNCEILRPNASWQKGKIRISLEFCPDETKVTEISESNKSENSQLSPTLDDIRQMNTGDSQ